MTSLRSSGRLLLTFAVAVTCGALAPGIASACSGPWPGTAFASAQPSDTAVNVPLNVEVLVRYSVGYGCALSLDPQDVPVLRIAGSTDPLDEVELQAELVDSQLYILSPTAPLSPNTIYEVFGIDSMGDWVDEWDCGIRASEVLATFTTGATTDDIAPVPDGAIWDCTDTIVFEGSTCEMPTESAELTPLSIGPASDNSGGPVTYDIYENSADPEPLLHRWPLPGLTATVVEGGPTDVYTLQGIGVPVLVPPGDFTIVAVDAAGNRSTPFSTGQPPGACPESPSSSSKCSASGPGATSRSTGAPLTAMLMVLLMLVGRRVQSAHRSST